MTTKLPPALADIASQAEAEAGTADDKFMTPERTAEAIAALESGGGLVLLATATASDDSEVEIDNTVFTSTYDEYIIVATQIQSTTDDDDLRIQLSQDNGSSYFTTNYSYAVRAHSSNGGFDSYDSTSDSRINVVPNTSNYGVGNGADESLNFTMRISNPLSTDPRPMLYWTAAWVGADARVNTCYAAAMRRAGAGDANFNNMRIYFDAANIKAGEFRIYGVKKS